MNGVTLTIEWDAGEPGCSYDVYYSLPNDAVNFGDLATTPPVSVGVGVLTANIGPIPISFLAPTEVTGNVATFLSAADSAVNSLRLALTFGEASFNSTLATTWGAIIAQLDTLALATDRDLTSIKSGIDNVFATMQGKAATVAGLYSYGTWYSYVAPEVASGFASLGLLFDGNPGRYTLYDGTTTDEATLPLDIPVTERCKPYVRNAIVRAVVRASKGGVQEMTDQHFKIELDADGAVVPPRPNQALVSSVAMDGSLGIAVTGIVYADDAYDAADFIDVYVTAFGVDPDPDTPSASITLSDPADTAYVQSGSTTVTVGGAGWYQVSVAARSGAGSRSALSEPMKVNVFTTSMPAVQSLSAKVVRAKGTNGSEG
jgi:hypothetical protein